MNARMLCCADTSVLLLAALSKHCMLKDLSPKVFKISQPL